MATGHMGINFSFGNKYKARDLHNPHSHSSEQRLEFLHRGKLVHKSTFSLMPSITYSPVHRRFVSKMTHTPVGTSKTAAEWLQTVISPLPIKLSAELERFLSSCDRNLTDEVIHRTNVILGAIFPSSEIVNPRILGGLHQYHLMDSLWAGQRQKEALKLYYRVLESICVSEAQKLGTGNLTSLLTIERFHRCMLACSAELVSAGRKTSLLFPGVLERIGITAFDMIKVIESFIRHEKSLPRELMRHLNDLEELLLESMVWRKGSSLYNHLIIARPELSAEINRLGLLPEPMPSLDAIATQNHVSCAGLPHQSFSQKHKLLPGMDGDVRCPKRACTEYCIKLVDHKCFASPTKDCPPAFNHGKSTPLPPSPPLQSAFASPRQPNSQCARKPGTEIGITVLFKKMEMVAAVRISSMAERLTLSQQIKESVYRLFGKILFQQISLFFNRHIDRIILCCLYGVAKVSKLNLTFKKIIDNYIKQQKKEEDYVGIIRFYNEVFILAVKPLLEKIHPAEASDRVPEANNNDHCPGSPEMSLFRSIPDMSPKKISPAHNVYICKSRPSKKDALIWHGVKSYYARVGESTYPYESPKKDLNVINNCLNGSLKPRGMRNFDNADDVRLVSDSLVARCLFFPNDNSASKSPSKSERTMS